ncbi:hypothetical protein E8E14_003055 [Neopestalotiopsis sp. 37M]|nr:hypothetical protein E8E14_003055 [Neopestalotiopsis sp. 37M]
MNVTSNPPTSETGAPSLHNYREQEKNEGNGDTPSASVADSSPRQNSARKTVLLATLSSAGLLNILTVQSVVIMLPSIGEALQIPPTRQQMITSTYNISAGCLILFWGRLADIYGRRTTFLIGSTGFTLAALAIPFSPVEICFYVLRVLQGMSGAATIPSAIGILATTFPVGKSRNTAFVTFAAASSLGSIIGNVAGGVVGGYLSWKWVFWITSIISGTVTVAAYILTRHKSFTQRPQGSTDTYVDWLGGVIISICGIVSPLLFALPTISPDATYWAFGFPAMFLGFSVDIVAPVVSLFVAKCLPEGDQALGAGLLQTANQVGRALGLAVATIAQSAAQGGSHEKEDLLRGLRAAQWVNVALTILALVIAFMFFRGLGKA